MIGTVYLAIYNKLSQKEQEEIDRQAEYYERISFEEGLKKEEKHEQTTICSGY